MEFKDTVSKRHSVRDFKDQSVSKSDLTEIIKLAQRAPSWVNSQPWKVYVASGQTLQTIKDIYVEREDEKGDPDFPVMHREDWSDETQANMKQWRHEIVHHFPSFNEAHEKMSSASTNLYHAPTIIFLTIPKNSSLWSIFDIGSFAQTLMLAAKDKGLDTIPTYTSVRFPEVIRQEIDISDDESLVIGISIGYPKNATINTYKSKREPIENILNFKD
jgi:Nitroreductase